MCICVFLSVSFCGSLAKETTCASMYVSLLCVCVFGGRGAIFFWRPATRLTR